MTSTPIRECLVCRLPLKQREDGMWVTLSMDDPCCFPIRHAWDNRHEPKGGVNRR